MARNAPLLATGLAVLALTFAGCAGDNGGNGEAASPGETPSTANSCSTISPNSPGEEDCQAAGIPGRTVSPDRCGVFTASPTPGGIIEGTFGPFCEKAVATTYSTSLIPDDSSTIVSVEETAAGSTVQLQAQGFAANTMYSARLHEGGCAADPADAGPEYQGGQGSESGPSPLILDFTTDAAGNATASTTVPWTLPENDGGESLLLLDAGQGGQAGDPVGCVNLVP